MASDKPSRPPSSIPDAGPAWGATRDALAAVHNLGALLKSPRVSASTAAGVFPEVRDGLTALRTAFLTGQVTSVELGPRVALCAFGVEKTDELEKALNSAENGLENAKTRIALEQLAAKTAIELDAAIELLDLADRAARPVRTELSFEQLARVALRHGTSIRPRETVRARMANPDPALTLTGDAHVSTRLIALAISAVHGDLRELVSRGTSPRDHGSGAEEVTLLVLADARSVRIEIRPSAPADASLPEWTARVPRRIPPTAGIVRAAAQAVSATFVVENAHVVLTLPRAL